MKDFDKVGRYNPEDVQLGHMPWEQCRGSMWEDEVGDFVQYEDYQDLLEAYKELKWRMEQLEK